METQTQTIEYESPHFLQSLFANDLSLLKELERALRIRVTTRDGWLKFDGAPADVERAREVFRHLESVRRKGGDINAHTFRMALGGVISGDEGKLMEALSDTRLLGAPTRSSVMPRTEMQLKYLRAMREHDVVFGIGPAGTGKTFLAMAHALQLLKDRQVDRIVVTRPAVEAGEALGFLPGDLHEKIFPYLRPLYDALYEMVEYEDAQKFVDRNMIEVAPLAYMRGRTLNRACVILDEAQNTTGEQMFMFLTRMGEESQCIVTGDPTQIDLRPQSRSGLVEAIEVLKNVPGVQFTEFTAKDVVRHPVVQRIIEAYGEKRKR